MSGFFSNKHTREKSEQILSFLSYDYSIPDAIKQQIFEYLFACLFVLSSPSWSCPEPAYDPRFAGIFPTAGLYEIFEAFPFSAGIAVGAAVSSVQSVPQHITASVYSAIFCFSIALNSITLGSLGSASVSAPLP